MDPWANGASSSRGPGSVCPAGPIFRVWSDVWVLIFKPYQTISASSSSSTAPPSMAKLGCDDHCGNISIPYPFGIGNGQRCYHNIEWFSINCDNSSHPPKPFLNHSKLDLEVLSIEIDGYRKSVTVNSPIPSNSCGNGSDQQNTAGSSSGTGNWRSPDLRGSPFLYSPDNDLIAVGCVNVLLSDGDGESTAGCTSACKLQREYHRQ